MMLDDAREMQRLSDSSDFALWRVIGDMSAAYAQAQMDEIGDAPERIRRGLTVLEDMNFHLAHPRFLGYLCEVQTLQGALDEAIRTAEDALLAKPEDLKIAQPSSLILRGELLLKNGQSEAAEQDFRKALAMAHSMKAKLNELRATTSLARLLDSTGRREEARTKLADIYNWFTEGFDTADLKDARALLDRLDGES
jgi:Flp pilus assembly protein TadD